MNDETASLVFVLALASYSGLPSASHKKSSDIKGLVFGEMTSVVEPPLEIAVDSEKLFLRGTQQSILRAQLLSRVATQARFRT